MATNWNSDERKLRQFELLWTTIEDNELLPYSPIKSVNKQLTTSNKSFIRAINEVVDKLAINNATVMNFSDKFNSLVGNNELEVEDWNNLKKIDRNVIRAIYKIYLDVLQLSEDMLTKANVDHKHTLADLTDVDITNKTNGYALIYDSAAGKFISKVLPSGGSGSNITDSTTNGNIVVDGAELNVYTHPANHSASIITQDTNNRFVTDAEKTTWNAKASTNVVTQSSNGLMSSVDKTKLDSIANNANNYVHPVNHPASIITQDVNNRFVTDAEKTTWNAKANLTDVYSKLEVYNKTEVDTKLADIASGGDIDLSNYYNKQDIDTQLSNKVDKITGKQLSTEDYTTTEKNKLSTISSNANVTASSTTNGNIKINGVETTVYTHPANHSASIITQDTNNRFVTDNEKSTWNAKASTNAVTQSTNGLMSSADKAKLDGIANGANNYIHPENHPANIIIQDTNNRFVTDAEKTTWNAKASTDIVTQTINGLMISSDKVKLDNIEINANNYTHPETHPANIIVQDTNNRFVTDTEKSAWNALISQISDLQTQLSDALGRIEILEGGTPAEPTVEWSYDFIVPQSTGVYNLASNVAWTHALTVEDVYGPTLDGTNSKMKLLTLGVQDGTPNEPGQEVPRDGFDAFTAPSMHGAFQYDADLQQIMFDSGAMNPYYFRIVKYV